MPSQAPQPDIYFYYILSGFLASGFVFLIVAIVVYFKNAFEKLVEKVQQISTEQIVMKKDIETATSRLKEEDFERLSSLVAYKILPKRKAQQHGSIS